MTAIDLTYACLLNVLGLCLVTLLASVSQLNLRSGFGRFVPVAGSRTSTLIRWGYVSAIGLALLTGIGLVVLMANGPSLVEGFEVTPLLAWLVPLAVVLWTAFLVQDHALVALRRTAIVPVDGAMLAPVLFVAVTTTCIRKLMSASATT